MKLYVAGPMTGKPDLNFPAFHEMTAKLRALGHTVLNPAEVPQGFEYEEYMTIDFAYISVCDGIVLLDGWKESSGAIREVAFAQENNKQIFESCQDLSIPKKLKKAA